MPKHRYFYVENGQRKEELVSGKWRKVQRYDGPRSHMIIRDQIGDGVKGVFNHATSKRYDSRSRYLADTRAAGCEVVGNDFTMKGRPKQKVSNEPIPLTLERLNQQRGWGF